MSTKELKELGSLERKTLRAIFGYNKIGHAEFLEAKNELDKVYDLTKSMYEKFDISTIDNYQAFVLLSLKDDDELIPVWVHGEKDSTLTYVGLYEHYLNVCYYGVYHTVKIAKKLHNILEKLNNNGVVIKKEK